MSGIALFTHPSLTNQNQALLTGTIKQMEYFSADTPCIYEVGQSFLPTDFVCQTEVKIKSINECRLPEPFLLHVNLPSSLFSRVCDQLEFRQNTALFSKNIQVFSTIDGKTVELDLKLPEKRTYELAQDSTQENAIHFDTGMRILKWESDPLDDEPTFLNKVHAANLKVVDSSPKENNFRNFLTQALSSNSLITIGTQNVSFDRKNTEYSYGKINANREEVYEAKLHIHGTTFLMHCDDEFLYVYSAEQREALGNQFAKIELPLSQGKISPKSTISTSHDFGVLTVKFSVKFLPELPPVPQKNFTTIAVHTQLKFGDNVDLRRSTDSWRQSISMGNVDQNLWVWSWENLSAENAEFKILFNDEKWEIGENRIIKKGERIEITPQF